MTAEAPAIRVDVWNWRLDAPDEARLWLHLSDDEKARADRYAFAHARAGFIASRGRVRELLGDLVGLAPAALVFAYAQHGKPVLSQRPDIVFNFSDTGALGCLAIAPGSTGPLGVDIERIRSRDWLELSGRFFAPAEHALMQGLPEADLCDAFFRGWTRKEAFLKAMGTGLSTRLDAFEVTLLAHEAPRITRIDPSLDAGRPQDWALAVFDPAPQIAGAIALRTGGADIELVVREKAG